MKRFLITLIISFIIYYGVIALFNITTSGFENSYQINNDHGKVDIKEVYNGNKKDENDNYYINIKSGNYEYSYQTYYSFNKSKNIISDIYTSDNCIYPVFKNDTVLYDITCIIDNKQVYYHNIINQYPNIDSFANSIEGYDVNKWIDNEKYDELINNAKIKYKTNNVTSDHLLSVVYYKGLINVNYNIPNRVYALKLFNNDVYNQYLGVYIKNKYVVADYSFKNYIRKFIVADIKNNSYYEIETDDKISYNSMVQGTVENSVYILDLDNMKQYEIDIKNNTITEVGNNSTKILYYDGKELIRITFAEAKNKGQFVNNNKSTSNSEYARIDDLRREVSGYQYLYKANGNKYDCYRRNAHDDKLTYLFTTSSIDRIVYQDDYVYYIDGSSLRSYQDEYGDRELVNYREFPFNENLQIYVTK